MAGPEPVDPEEWSGSWCSDRPTFPDEFLTEVFGHENTPGNEE